MWKIAICDDEEKVLESLESKLIKAAGDKVSSIRRFTNKETLLIELERDCDIADIVLMDIELKGESGIRAAEEVLEVNPDAQIIFVSGYDDYFTDVYAVDHVFFLKKPVREEELLKALQKAGEKLVRIKTEHLHLTNKTGHHKIPLHSILYMEKDKRKLNIVTDSGTIAFYLKFEDVMPMLSEYFMRCHNSYLINLTRMDAMERGSFQVAGHENIPISRAYYKEVQKAYIDYLERNL